jgi:serine/threonine protein kinase
MDPDKTADATAPHLDDELRELGRTLAPTLRCGPYLLAHHIASGAVGDIFAATRDGDEGLLRYAVKVLRHGPDAAETLARFERERRILRELHHPCVVEVKDEGVLADGRLWFAMPMIPGGPIVQECDDRRLPIATRLEVFAHVCDAVHAVHVAGVLHRDLTVHNILLAPDRDGGFAPAIVDFGIARALLSNDARLTPVHVAHRLGTPEFMSPEQWELGVGACDARSDVFALGVVLGVLIAGVVPRAAASRTPAPRRRTAPGAMCSPSDAFTRRCTDAPAETREIASARACATPDDLLQVLRQTIDAIVARATDAQPDRRYQSAAALAEAARISLAR